MLLPMNADALAVRPDSSFPRSTGVNPPIPESPTTVDESAASRYSSGVASDNPPTGMGEVGIPTLAPAIGNAVAQLTGKRLRHLPMSSDRVKKALA